MEKTLSMKIMIKLLHLLLQSGKHLVNEDSDKMIARAVAKWKTEDQCKWQQIYPPLPRPRETGPNIVTTIWNLLFQAQL